MADVIWKVDLEQSQELLDELFAEVKRQEGTLSGGTSLGSGGRALQKLFDLRLRWGDPRNELIRLTPELFATQGVELTPIRRQQMKDQFDFYYMTLPAHMVPQQSLQLREMRANIKFLPEGTDEPIVQAMFPKPRWRDVISWGGGAQLVTTSDLNLDARLVVPPGTDLAQLPDAIQAHLASTNHLNALITVHDYTFKMGRVEIVSVGEGSSECDWQLKNPELQETYTIQFGIVFKVPQGTQSIRLTGMMAVSPKISWLVAQLRDVYDYLSEKLKAILSRPLSERTTAEQLWRSEGETWKLTLPH